jgi:hypothetical protein
VRNEGLTYDTTSRGEVFGYGGVSGYCEVGAHKLLTDKRCPEEPITKEA